MTVCRNLGFSCSSSKLGQIFIKFTSNFMKFSVISYNLMKFCQNLGFVEVQLNQG
ncbi:hypothetical protein Hanom_Chr02g00165831 [Helianthus anomalus]